MNTVGYFIHDTISAMRSTYKIIIFQKKAAHWITASICIEIIHMRLSSNTPADSRVQPTYKIIIEMFQYSIFFNICLICFHSNFLWTFASKTRIRSPLRQTSEVESTKFPRKFKFSCNKRASRSWSLCNHPSRHVLSCLGELSTQICWIWP